MPLFCSKCENPKEFSDEHLAPTNLNIIVKGTNSLPSDSMVANEGPFLILKRGSSESRGKEAQRNNIAAAKIVCEMIRTSLGPRGMDKMLVDSGGDAVVTNDGATILKELDVEHPAARMMVEISKATDSEVGDGTTSAVILAGSLLTGAYDLIAKDVHPTIIASGYQQACDKAVEILREIAVKVDPSSREELLRVAETSLMTKMVVEDAPRLAALAVDAVTSTMDRVGQRFKADIERVKVEKKPGGSLQDSVLVKGIILDKEVVHSGMPKRVEEAKIALVNSALEIEKTEFKAEIRVDNPEQIQEFSDEEHRILRAMVDKLKEAGANVAICLKGIDDLAQHYLAKEGILGVSRVKANDLSKLSKATGARMVTDLDDLSSKDIGFAKLVEERKLEEDRWIFVEGCENPKSMTILIRGGTQRIVDEAERALHDALMVTRDVVENPGIVAGGGAPEAELSFRLRDWAQKLSGREQLAVLEFANALDSIPLTLAENAGMDPLDVAVELKASHGRKGRWFGVDALNGKVSDMMAKSVTEPLVVKLQIIKSATEAAAAILRIDDVIAAKRATPPPVPPGGKGGGAGGSLQEWE